MYVALLLWFNIFLGLNFIFLCLKLVIIHYHTPKQRKIKFEPRHSHLSLCTRVCLILQIWLTSTCWLSAPLPSGLTFFLLTCFPVIFAVRIILLSIQSTTLFIRSEHVFLSFCLSVCKSVFCFILFFFFFKKAVIFEK